MNAEQLIFQAKFEEAYKILKNFQSNQTSMSKDHLLAYIFEGKIYCYREEYKKVIEIGEVVYEDSQKVGDISSIIDALLLKAYIGYFGKLDEAFESISKIEDLITSTSHPSAKRLSKQKADLLFLKSLLFHLKTDLTKSIELSLQWLTLSNELTEKLDISRIYWHLTEIYLYKGESDLALDYAKKSLTIQKELNNKLGIAKSQYLIGLINYTKGNFDKALAISKQVLINKEISNFTKIDTYHLLGIIYKEKGELDRTIRYYNRAAKLAEREGYVGEFILNIIGIGSTYRMKGKLDQAIEFLKYGLILSGKNESSYGMSTSLFYLILTYLDKNSLDQAEMYLNQLEKFISQAESKVFNQIQTIAKALVFKKKGRIRNRTQAELLLKQITENEIVTPQLYLLSLVNLCELFLEELRMTNNSEVLDDLNPLIIRILKVAENQNAYLWLAETKLLKGKLALIQMDIEKAKQLFTDAQRIAELHGLNLLALKISNEHDNLLEQLNVWDNLKISNAPISERIELASFDGVIDRMQGKRTLEPLKLTPETPVLLLIIAEGGIPLLSNTFTEELSFEDDLISSFLSAFNTFSGELFSKGLDRAKFGEYTILMQTIESYSICYLFKGQTYIAKQKISQFSDRVQDSKIIWDALNKFYNNSQMIQLKDLPELEIIINEIFIPKTVSKSI